MRVTACFVGIPGDENDNEVHHHMKTFGGEFTGSGFNFATGERDIEYEFTDEQADEAAQCAEFLGNMGYKITRV